MIFLLLMCCSLYIASLKLLTRQKRCPPPPTHSAFPDSKTRYMFYPVHVLSSLSEREAHELSASQFNFDVIITCPTKTSKI